MVTLADLPTTLTGWLGPLVDSPRLLMAVMMIVLVLMGARRWNSRRPSSSLRR